MLVSLVCPCNSRLSFLFILFSFFALPASCFLLPARDTRLSPSSIFSSVDGHSAFAMNIHSLRPSRPPRPFLFALFAVSILASKLLHLYQHGASIGFLRFVLYFPTFFIPDVLVAIVHRILLHHGNGALWTWIGGTVGGLMA